MQRDFAARREQALKSEAEVLAKDLFDSAAAKQREAERLAGALDVAGARQAYADAGKGYDEAQRVAGGVAEARTQADRERARMEGAKGQASADSPSYAEAHRLEESGAAAYRRLAFKEAGDSFRASADLFARAVPPKAPPVPRDPSEGIAPFGPNPRSEAEIRSVLEQWKRAFETKDIRLVQRLRPGMSRDELQKLGETFHNARTYQLELRIETLKIGPDEAQARTFKRDVITAKDGQFYQSETMVTVVLRRQGSGWTIADIK